MLGLVEKRASRSLARVWARKEFVITVSSKRQFNKPPLPRDPSDTASSRASLYSTEEPSHSQARVLAPMCTLALMFSLTYMSTCTHTYSFTHSHMHMRSHSYPYYDTHNTLMCLLFPWTVCFSFQAQLFSLQFIACALPLPCCWAQ